MTYTRKTRDVWNIQQWTGPEYKWETVCQEFTRKEAKARLTEYRENQPQYPARMKLYRERIAEEANQNAR